MSKHRTRGSGRRAVTATLLAGALAGAGPLAAQTAGGGAEGAPALTLDQAVAAALEHGPQVVQAEGAVSTAAAAERSAFGAYLPTLSLSTSGSLAATSAFGTTAISTGTRDSYGAGLSASWDVYTGGRRGAESDRARAESAAAAANLSEQRYAVTLQAKQGYYDVLRAQELAEVARASVERAGEGIDAAQQRLDVGSATRSDVLRAQLELNQAKQSLLEAQSQERTASYALGRLVGEDGPVRVVAPAELRVTPLSEGADELVGELVARAPTVVTAQAQVASADAAKAVARSQYLPTVRLSSGYDLNTSDLALAAGQTGWSVGLGVSIPLFDGFQRAEGSEQARVQASTAAAALADARRGVRADAEKALAALDLAASRIGLADEAVSAATEDLRVQQERYKLGASTILDLTASQESLVQAQTDRVTARFDYQVARAQLEALAGREL